MQKLNRAIIFVHYDKHDMVDAYVYTYLKELQQNASHLVFVSTAKLSSEEIKNLSQYCSKIIVRENIGYDFMSYKIGLESFNYKNYDEVVICNDSVYGPLYPLANVFEDMQNNTCDFWGITDNTDISYHLQSYFLVFKKNVIQSDTFKTFWKQVKVLKSKDDIIGKYEIGLTKFLLDSRFSSAVYVNFKATKAQTIQVFLKKLTPTKIINKVIAIGYGKDKLKRIGKINTTHYFWKELLLSEKIPFIKIELLRDNPMQININNVEQVIQEVSDYDTQLINNHLDRMKVDR